MAPVASQEIPVRPSAIALKVAVTFLFVGHNAIAPEADATCQFVPQPANVILKMEKSATWRVVVHNVNAPLEDVTCPHAEVCAIVRVEDVTCPHAVVIANVPEESAICHHVVQTVSVRVEDAKCRL